MNNYTKINIDRADADKLRTFCSLDFLTIFSYAGTYFMKFKMIETGCEEFNAIRLTDYGVGEACHISPAEEVLPVKAEINIFRE